MTSFNRICRRSADPSVGGIALQIEVRTERETDHLQVFEVEQSAFGSQVQANLVDALRRSANPSLSLVAVLESKVVGHIFFSPVTMSATRSPIAAQLSPIAVVPEFQGQGIGSALIRAGVEQNCLDGVCFSWRFD